MNPNSSPSVTPPRPQRPVRRGRWLLLLVPLVLGIGGVLLSVALIRPGSGAVDSSAPGPQSPQAQAEPPPRAPARPTASTPAAAQLSPEEAEREAQRELWTKRLERARFTLDSYRESTRFPPESRPIEEHPDLVHPFAPERKQPINKESREVALVLKQDKVFVAADEVVRFFVGCENAASHQPLPCEVHSAMAREVTYTPQAGQAPGVPLDFNDSGRNGDEVAGDNTWTGSFQPAKQGFAMFEGTLRIDVRVRANGSTEGGASFDIQFTAAPPASFTGKMREAVEQGSLQLYVGLQVRKAGRYVMAARVDDASGIPFAYLMFNEELEAGAREVRFTVFGLLIHEQVRKKGLEFPLKLRDVEGFLLRENADPDRELMKSLNGYVHVTQEYAPERFSSEEWTSEERQRYLDEFTKDVNEAQGTLGGLGGPKGPPAP